MQSTSTQTMKKPPTYGKCDHGFVRIWGEFHPVHDGPDGVERVVGHLRSLHLPPLPAALGLGWIQAAIDIDVVHPLPGDSCPIQGFCLDHSFAMNSITIHLNQIGFVVHPGDDGRENVHQ